MDQYLTQDARASSAAPAADSSSRHAVPALVQLARLLGRLAAQQALKAGAGIELSNEDSERTPGGVTAS